MARDDYAVSSMRVLAANCRTIRSDNAMNLGWFRIPSRLLSLCIHRSAPGPTFSRPVFAFASYNAGLTRVRKLRAEAGERGLDPNVWFHNVEYIAAERVG